MKSLLLVLALAICETIFVSGQVREEWVARYGDPKRLLTPDIAWAIAVDGNGNIYVTGQSGGEDTGYDYATIKYDTDGNELWVARYDGPAHMTDLAHAIAVDKQANVYVTGCSFGVGTGFDYATIKYDTDGNELWIARYDGPAHDWDEARAIAVDQDGNVYVTGWSVGVGTGVDYATIKYDTDGNELWVARYDGPAHGEDRVTAIAVDRARNVYVTGYDWGGFNTYYDYATVKYDPSGNEVWVARYDGPAHNVDQAYALALDSEGNVYVTGGSAGFDIYVDYVTIEYDGEGNELWVARYERGGAGKAIALDSEGNVYVTGVSYTTIKYDNNGNQLWVAQYREGSFNTATAMALDSEANTYVTGWSLGEYNVPNWATVKYDRDGKQIWSIRFSSHLPSGSASAYAIALDANRNVFVTGSCENMNRTTSYCTVKYSQETSQK